MSGAVAGIAEAIARFGPEALFVTVTSSERPHSVPVTVAWAGEHALVPVRAASISAANLAERPFASLVWPPGDRTDGYHLIFDGLGKVVGDMVIMTPTKVVLHQPADAAKDAAGDCGGDCVVLYKM